MSIGSDVLATATSTVAEYDEWVGAAAQVLEHYSVPYVLEPHLHVVGDEHGAEKRRARVNIITYIMSRAKWGVKSDAPFNEIVANAVRVAHVRQRIEDGAASSPLPPRLANLLDSIMSLRQDTAPPRSIAVAFALPNSEEEDEYEESECEDEDEDEDEVKDEVEATEDDANAPMAYKCPITQCVMRDPVLLSESGHTFERAAITKWLRRSLHEHGTMTCPITRKRVRSLKSLTCNMALRDAIEAWRRKS